MLAGASAGQLGSSIVLWPLAAAGAAAAPTAAALWAAYLGIAESDPALHERPARAQDAHGECSYEEGTHPLASTEKTSKPHERQG